jgi:hypothetical protein
MICAELGQEPDPTKMPPEHSDFPEEVQVAFFMCNMLSDQWDGHSGSYLGKDWTNFRYLMDIYKMDYEPTIIYFYAKLYDSIVMSERTKKNQQARKAAERKGSSGAKQYSHNVKG